MAAGAAAVVEDESWMARGTCAGTDADLFFPERGESPKTAKAACAACPVRDECRDYALRHNIHHGIWGGLTERERRRVRKGLAVAAATAAPPAPPAPPPGPPIRSGTQLPADAVQRRSVTPHGAAIRGVLADGGWHTLDAIAVAVRPTLTEGSDVWKARHARNLTSVTLHNMRRNGLLESADGHWRLVR